MKVTAFNTQKFEHAFLLRANQARHHFTFLETALTPETTHLARGAQAVSVSPRDTVSAPVLAELADAGVRYVAVRATGTDNVDLITARQLGLRVANVPAYSPHAVAEHAVGLMLALSRHLRQADQQLRTNDFRLDHLLGFELHNKTVGILGVGHVGSVVARILHGFGCQLLGVDVRPNPDLTQRYGLRYVTLPELCAQADIISVHTTLTADTFHLIDGPLLHQMKRGVMLINTGRGGVLDTAAAVQALKSGQLGFLGLDVYEKEKGLFFADHRQDLLLDDLFARLLTFPNVLLTGHQAYLTSEALTIIAETTVASFSAWGLGQPAAHEVGNAGKQPVAGAAL